MAASSSVPMMMMMSRRLAALALCLVLLLDITLPSLVTEANKGKGGHRTGGGRGGGGRGGGAHKGGQQKPGGGYTGGTAGHGGKGGGHHGKGGGGHHKPGGGGVVPPKVGGGGGHHKPGGGGGHHKPGRGGIVPPRVGGGGGHHKPGGGGGHHKPGRGGVVPPRVGSGGGHHKPGGGGVVPPKVGGGGGHVVPPKFGVGKPAGGAVPGAPTNPGGGGVPVPESGKGITYHGGPLMTGDINLSILFYGAFTAGQKDVIRSFLRSLENTENDHIAAVHRWWDIVESYQLFTNKPGVSPTGASPRLRVKVGTQQSDDKYSVGKVLTIDFIKTLFKKADSGKPNTLVVIFTGSQVTVTGLCRGRCYEHGLVDNKPYLIVGNPELECPGACGWPFIRLDYGSPNQVTVNSPNGNAGIDAMLINFASGLAASVTNPFNTGFFKPGPKDPIEAGNACENIFGSGAVPGQTGKVEVDPATGSSYNAVGEKGAKFMLPAVWNPRTSNCWTAM